MAAAWASMTSRDRPCERERWPSSVNMVNRQVNCGLAYKPQAPSTLNARCNARHESLPPLQEQQSFGGVGPLLAAAVSHPAGTALAARRWACAVWSDLP